MWAFNPLIDLPGRARWRKRRNGRSAMSSSVNVACLMALRTDDSGIRRNMLMNSLFFAESTVNCLDAMANNLPHWIGKDIRCGDNKVNRSSQCCNLAWSLTCVVLGMVRCGLTRQYLHRGVTYQSDWKDWADGVEYLKWGAKLVSYRDNTWFTSCIS